MRYIIMQNIFYTTLSVNYVAALLLVSYSLIMLLFYDYSYKKAICYKKIKDFLKNYKMF